jgi:hypothetical protein
MLPLSFFADHVHRSDHQRWPNGLCAAWQCQHDRVLRPDLACDVQHASRQSGLGSGLQNTTRQAGALMAVSILGSVLNTALLAGRLPAAFVILGVADVAGITLA